MVVKRKKRVKRVVRKTAKKSTRKVDKRKTTKRKVVAKRKTTVKRKAVTKRKTAKRKTTKRKTTKRKPNAKFMAPQALTKALEAVVGKGPLPRTMVIKKLWMYIKRKKLQDPKNRRNIRPDALLSKVLGSKVISMFSMTKKVSKHIG